MYPRMISSRTNCCWKCSRQSNLLFTPLDHYTPYLCHETRPYTTVLHRPVLPNHRTVCHIRSSCCLSTDQYSSLHPCSRRCPHRFVFIWVRSLGIHHRSSMSTRDTNLEVVWESHHEITTITPRGWCGFCGTSELISCVSREWQALCFQLENGRSS